MLECEREQVIGSKRRRLRGASAAGSGGRTTCEVQEVAHCGFRIKVTAKAWD